MFTHHQKTVVFDTPAADPAAAAGGRREVAAYAGGLDLCGGRYDTPAHPLFGTFVPGGGGDHEGDFYQPNIPLCSAELGACACAARLAT